MHVNGSPAHNSNGPVGSRTRSPSATRTESSLTSSLTNLAGNLNINLKGAGTRRKFTENEMQCLLGEAVNNLIKYYLEPTGERGNVTALLCGESGLVPCLELVLHHGFRSSRIFSRNLFLWDYLRKKIWIETIFKPPALRHMEVLFHSASSRLLHARSTFGNERTGLCGPLLWSTRSPLAVRNHRKDSTLRAFIRKTG